MQKLLVTGASGFLGYYLVQCLKNKSYSVVATSKDEHQPLREEGNILYERFDFTNPEMVEHVFNKYQPDVVIHCGAMSKPDECELNKELAFRTNVTGTVYLLNAARTYQSFFLFLSSDFVFDGVKGMYSEEDEPAPVNYYGQTKALAEGAVQDYPYGWAIVRTVLVYGRAPGARQNIVTSTASALQKGQHLKIFKDQVRTPTYVEDLAKGIVSIADQKAVGIFHLCGVDVLTPYDIAVAVARYFNFDTDYIRAVVEDEFLQPARRPLKTGLNIAKAKRLLGYTCISFAEGLRKTLGEPQL